MWDAERGGRRRSSVVRESEFKSEDPGFDPLAGQGKRPESTLGADLFSA